MIRTIGPNHFEVKVYVGRDPATGKERRLSRTVHGPKRKAREVERDLRLKKDAVPTVLTVGELLDRWIRIAPLERSTAYTARLIIRTWLKPAFGDVKLSKLKSQQISHFYGSIDRAPGTILKIHQTLRSALQLAVEWEWIDRNPAALARPPARPYQAPNPATAEEVQILLSRSTGWLHVFIRLAVSTGMRRGEICALRWEDIGDGFVKIARALGSAEGGAYVKSTKTGVRHRISLDVASQSVLEAYRSECEARAAALDSRIPGTGFVFSSEADGSVPTQPGVVTNEFVKLRNHCGLTVQLRNLRHFHATALLDAGTPIAAVSRRLGHARLTTTMEHYAGWLPSSDAQAAETIGSLLNSE